MKLKYTDGCTCTSLTVNDKETIDISFEEMKCVISKMIDHIWNIKTDIIPDIISFLIQDVGEEKKFKYGKYDIFDEIETYVYDYNDYHDYLTYINVPNAEFLIVNELVCEYTKLVRQIEWNNNLHCNEKYLNIIKSMLDKIDNFASFQCIFCKIMERCGKYKSVGHCDCCGDCIRKCKLEID